MTGHLRRCHGPRNRLGRPPPRLHSGGDTADPALGGATADPGWYLASIGPTGPSARGWLSAEVGEAAGLVRLDERLDDAVEVALQETGQVVDRQPDAMVGHPVVGEVVGPDLLRPLTRANLRTALLAPLGGLVEVAARLAPPPAPATTTW